MTLPFNASRPPFWYLILIRSGMLLLTVVAVPFWLDMAVYREGSYKVMTVLSECNTMLSAFLYGFKPAAQWMHIQSDSTGMYLFVLNAALLSLVGAVLYTLAFRQRIPSVRLVAVFVTFIRYTLAFKLLQYGFNKVFKYQFFEPEPNVLLTPFGMLPKELLYWSVNGISYGFSVFAGLLECFAGMLLLWKRTSVLGALLSVAILLQVVVVNFCYDISVKVLSLYLLLCSLMLLFPFLRSIVRFLTGAAVLPLSGIRNPTGICSSIVVYRIIKGGVLTMLACCLLYPYIISGNYNDDAAPRPLYHGAYIPQRIILNRDTFGQEDLAWKRIFIHRQHYFIVQDAADVMHDYAFTYEKDNVLHVYDASEEVSVLVFKEKESGGYTITGTWQGDLIEIDIAPVAWRDLPALRKGFHWRVDEENSYR